MLTLAAVHVHTHALIVALLVSALVGGVVYAVLRFGFKVVWAAAAGAITFLVLLALYLL